MRPQPFTDWNNLSRFYLFPEAFIGRHSAYRETQTEVYFTGIKDDILKNFLMIASDQLICLGKGTCFSNPGASLHWYAHLKCTNWAILRECRVYKLNREDRKNWNKPMLVWSVIFWYLSIKCCSSWMVQGVFFWGFFLAYEHHINRYDGKCLVLGWKWYWRCDLKVGAGHLISTVI